MARLELAGYQQLECAAQGGAADALFELGMRYCSGRDVEVDLISAHKWFNLAALRGNQAARHYRMEISSEMSSTEISSAQRLAREWLSQN